jgi:GNAT superfamily N-acetyltransferase
MDNRPKESPRIRTANIADATGIARVHIAGWRATYSNVLTAEFLAALDIQQWTARWMQRLRDAAADEAQLVLLDKTDGIAGFIAVGRAGDPKLREWGELQAIYLAPAYIGRGLGGPLHDAGLDALRRLGFRNAILWVSTDNVRARSFYERRGWKLRGVPAPQTVAGASILCQCYEHSLE